MSSNLVVTDSATVHTCFRVLSTLECVFGGEDGKGGVHPRYGSGGLPSQDNVSVPLSKHIYLSVFTGREELSQCHYFKLQLGKIFLGEA